jgi:hypothetical protein
MVKLTFTYEVITPESAAEGCTAEHGWYMPGGYQHPLEDAEGRHNVILTAAIEGDFDHVMRASDALRTIRSEMGCLDYVQANGEHLSAWESDGRQDYTTGANERRSVHVTAHPRLIAALARALQSR